jgi:hypothetical protein
VIRQHIESKRLSFLLFLAYTYVSTRDQRLHALNSAMSILQMRRSKCAVNYTQSVYPRAFRRSQLVCNRYNKRPWRLRRKRNFYQRVRRKRQKRKYQR